MIVLRFQMSWVQFGMSFAVLACVAMLSGSADNVYRQLRLLDFWFVFVAAVVVILAASSICGVPGQATYLFLCWHAVYELQHRSCCISNTCPQ